MQDPRFPQYPGGGPPPGPGASYPPQPSYPPYPPPPQVHPWQGQPMPPPSQAVPKSVVIVVVCAMVLLIGAAVTRVVFFPSVGPHTGAPEAGSVKYGHSGFDDGSVTYAAGLTLQDGKMVGDYLRATGWLPGGNAPTSKVRGYAMGSYGIGASGRGYGLPLATLESEGTGLRVIVYTSSRGFASDDVRAFGSAAQEALTTRFGKHVTFIVRVETKKGRGLSWDEVTWQ